MFYDQPPQDDRAWYEAGDQPWADTAARVHAPGVIRRGDDEPDDDTS